MWIDREQEKYSYPLHLKKYFSLLRSGKEISGEVTALPVLIYKVTF